MGSATEQVTDRSRFKVTQTAQTDPEEVTGKVSAEQSLILKKYLAL